VFFCAEGAEFHDVKTDLTNGSLAGSHRRLAELIQPFHFGHAGQLDRQQPAGPKEDAECRG
jgi:hypothetical protein